MIYLVTGAIRSGTSLMMQMCEASGIPVVKSASRDRLNARERLNPVSLYEPSWQDREQIGFPCMYDGHALKLVIPWLSSLAVHHYRVIMMQRDPEEIMDSRVAALDESWTFARRSQWVREYSDRMAETIRGLENRRDVQSVSVVDFDRLVANTSAVLGELASCGIPLLPHVGPLLVTPLWRVA
jgi:hypothetical protein